MPEDTGVVIATNAGYIGHDEIEAAKAGADLFLSSRDTDSPITSSDVHGGLPPVAPPIVLDEPTALKLRQYGMPNDLDWSDRPVPDDTDGYHIKRRVKISLEYAQANRVVETNWHVIVNNTGNTGTTYADADVVIGLAYDYEIYPLRDGALIKTLAGNPIQYNKNGVRVASAKRVYAIPYSREPQGDDLGFPIVLVLWDITEEPTDPAVGDTISYRVQRRSLTDNAVDWTDVPHNSTPLPSHQISRLYDAPSNSPSVALEWNKIYEYRVIKMSGNSEVVTTESVFVEAGPPLRPMRAVQFLIGGNEESTQAQNIVGPWDAIFYEYGVLIGPDSIDHNLTAAYVVYQRANPDLHADIPGVSTEFEVVAITTSDSLVLWSYNSRIDYDVQFVPITSHRQAGSTSELFIVHADNSESVSLAQLASLIVNVNGKRAPRLESPFQWPTTVSYLLDNNGTSHHRIWANPATLRTITVEPIPRAMGVSADNPADVQVKSSVDVIYNGLMNLDTGGAYAAGELIGNGVFDLTVPQEFADALADQSGFDEVPTDYLEIEIVVNSVDRSYTRTIKIAVGCWSDTSNFDLIRAATASAESVPSSSECEPDDVLSPNDHRYQHFLGSSPRTWCKSASS